MSDEIKEILDYLRKYIDNEETGEIIESKHTMNLLLDYITNLQEENERLSVELNQNMIERNNYLSRNEKAIYDLEKTKKLNDRHILARDNIVIHLDIDHIEYLLNILKGDNK